MRLARRYSADPDKPKLGEVIKGIREDIVGAVTTGPAPIPIRKAYSGMPQTFGGLFPAMVVRHSGGRPGSTGRGLGSNETVMGRFFPDELSYYVDFFTLSRIKAGDIAAPVKIAEDENLSAYESFLDSLFASGLRESARDIYIAAFESTLVDRATRQFLSDERQRGLLRLQAELRIAL